MECDKRGMNFVDKNQFRNTVEKQRNKRSFPFPGSPDKEVCKCCHGTGVQTNQQTGLRVKCPCCHGTGYWKKDITKFWKM